MAKAFDQATELDDGGLAGRGSTGCLHASDLDHEATIEGGLGVGEVYAGRGSPRVATSQRAMERNEMPAAMPPVDPLPADRPWAWLTTLL